MQACYLIMVTGENNNKYYNMFDSGGGTFRAEYGRVGVTKTTRVYNIGLWDRKYREKIKKGYKDVTRLHEKAEASKDFAGISDATINTLVNFLRSCSGQSVSSNYLVDASQVTKAQVEEAQHLLDLLSDTKKVVSFNDLLLKLYTVIPRRMNHVQDYLIQEKKQRQDVLTKEQNALDVMRTEVDSQVAVEIEPQQTVLEALGIEIARCPTEDLEIVDGLLGELGRNSQRVFRVVNRETQGRFEQGQTRLLFHGSGNSNWLNILSSGLIIRPTAAHGSMFGRGLYFADKSQKSANYTDWYSERGYLGIFEVNLGRTLDVHQHYYWHKQFPNHSEMKGYDSVSAYPGTSLRNAEYIVYRNSQATIKYLVELRG